MRQVVVQFIVWVKPTKAILAAGVSEVLLSDNADKTIVNYVSKHFMVRSTLILLNVRVVPLPPNFN